MFQLIYFLNFLTSIFKKIVMILYTGEHNGYVSSLYMCYIRIYVSIRKDELDFIRRIRQPAKIFFNSNVWSLRQDDYKLLNHPNNLVTMQVVTKK